MKTLKIGILMFVLAFALNVAGADEQDATYWCANCGYNCVQRFDFCRGMRGTDACLDDYFTCQSSCGLTCDGLMPV